MTRQTWKIKGQIYTHEQLMELRRQGLDPHKDDITMKFVTPRNEAPEAAPVEQPKKSKKADVEPEAASENVEPEPVEPEANEADAADESTSVDPASEQSAEEAEQPKKKRGRKPKAE